MTSADEYVVALGVSFQTGATVGLPDDEGLAREAVREAAAWAVGALLDGDIGSPEQVMRRIGQAIVATRVRPNEQNYVYAY